MRRFVYRQIGMRRIAISFTFPLHVPEGFEVEVKKLIRGLFYISIGYFIHRLSHILDLLLFLTVLALPLYVILCDIFQINILCKRFKGLGFLAYAILHTQTVDSLAVFRFYFICQLFQVIQPSILVTKGPVNIAFYFIQSFITRTSQLLMDSFSRYFSLLMSLFP